MNQIWKILLGFCALSGLVWLLGPEGDEKSFADWKYTIRMVSGGLFLISVFWALIDLWGSDRTSDSKLYWTVLGALFSPFVLPVYYYLRMIKKGEQEK